uniref:Cation efflux protein transmembrane domain-containing protein n=1 Tax=Latimeria chalumnae TaxID=7897 RepID=M3XGY0_LATCH|nr:PREDICTED: zinc transporter 1-like [Latimeria chalumnae]XP_014350404.1 PREDICTED: zinc transporter 1-like [Latimeria chalumnae]|eukprot:XP_006006592.2 PREDICTED: zinc transporter 1-like [Latimeria chalumnae]
MVTTIRYWFLLVLAFTWLVAEIIASRLCESLVLLVDSFHTLSICLAFFLPALIGCIERRPIPSSYTYGRERLCSLGVLISSLLLASLCFSIMLELIGRFLRPHPLQQPALAIAVGLAGFVINLTVKLWSWRRGHSYSWKKIKGSYQNTAQTTVEGSGIPVKFEVGGCHGDLVSSIESEEVVDLVIGNPCAQQERLEEDCGNYTSDLREESKEPTPAMAQGLQNQSIPAPDVENTLPNLISALALDLLGPSKLSIMLSWLKSSLPSVLVLIIGLIFYFMDHQCLHTGECHLYLLLDPTFCLVIMAVFLASTVPLLKGYGLMLLQGVPMHLNMTQLVDRLTCLPGVLQIHELHVWQLASQHVVATAHIQCADPSGYTELAKMIAKVFHEEGVHNSVVQPEFSQVRSDTEGSSNCLLACSVQCAKKLCCDNSRGPQDISPSQSGKQIVITNRNV